MRRLRAKNERGFRVVSANHVAIEHAATCAKVNDRDEPHVTAIREAHGLRAPWKMNSGTAARRFTHARAIASSRHAGRRCCSRRLPDRIARDGVAHAVVVLMVAEQHVLVAQLGSVAHPNQMRFTEATRTRHGVGSHRLAVGPEIGEGPSGAQEDWHCAGRGRRRRHKGHPRPPCPPALRTNRERAPDVRKRRALRSWRFRRIRFSAIESQ